MYISGINIYSVTGPIFFERPFSLDCNLLPFLCLRGRTNILNKWYNAARKILTKNNNKWPDTVIFKKTKKKSPMPPTTHFRNIPNITLLYFLIFHHHEKAVHIGWAQKRGMCSNQFFYKKMNSGKLWGRCCKNWSYHYVSESIPNTFVFRNKSHKESMVNSNYSSDIVIYWNGNKTADMAYSNNNIRLLRT